MRTLAITVIASLLLTGCGFGRSAFNPLNWFGGSSTSTPIQTVAAPRQPIAQQVTKLEAAPTPGGLIISAVALPPTQGFWNAELVRLPSDDPSLYLLEFQLLPPLDRAPAGAVATREVLTGIFIRQSDLAGIRSIAVQGETNRRTIRRQ